MTTVTIVIILKLKGSDDVSVDRHRKNTKSAYYALACYDNDITDPHWRIHICPDDHHFKYNRESDEFILNHHGISILQLKVQPKKQLQTNNCSIDISCIKWKAMEVFHRVFEACQRISTSLNIPLSVFLVAAVNGKQAIEVMDNNKRETPVSKSLSVISLHEADSLAMVHYELDIANTKLIGDGEGRLPWTATNSHGKTSLIYHKQLKFIKIREQGNYLILLSLNTYIYSSKKRRVLIQTCLVASKNEACRRLVLEKGMSAPLTALDINRLSEGDTVFVKFSNLPELYYSKLNSLSILRLPENIQYSKYELNKRDYYPWTSEFVILKWKEIAAKSKAISLHGGIVFDIHEDGNYWIVVCLTIDTNQRLVKNMNELSACIIISDGKQHCQNISVQTGVVFPMMVTTVTYIPSGQSFRITLKNINLLYRSAAFNSVFVLKL